MNTSKIVDTLETYHYKRKEYVMNMLGSIPHQKFCFYHLRTQGRAGIKLVNVDTSPTYL